MSNYPANAELVAVAWLSQRVPELSDQMVATTLPSNADAWRADGFVQVQAFLGGIGDAELPEARRPIVQVDTWAAPATAGSNRPPWNKAALLMEYIQRAVEGQQYSRPVELLPAYRPARVMSVYFQTQPRRVVDDPSGFARFTADLAVDWSDL